jgi:hypothetical protein
MDEAKIRALVDRTAIELGSPASPSERAAIAASQAKFMRTRWRGRFAPGSGNTRNIDRGAMMAEAAVDDRLDTWRALNTRERQLEAGRRSAALSKGRHDAAIDAALSALRDEGKRVTQKVLAVRADVSLSTVKRRWPTVMKSLH